MPHPEQLRHLIDRCTVAAVKAALFQSPDVEKVFYVKPSTPLENVGVICVDGDADALAILVDSGEVSFPSPSFDSNRMQVADTAYLMDSDYVSVLLLPPVYLIQAEVHREPMESAIAVRGLKLCNDCRSICGAERSSLHFAPPVNYSDGCNEYCLSCWLEGRPKAKSLTAWLATLNSMGSDYRVVTEPKGDLAIDYDEVLQLGYDLAIMPVARLELKYPISFPGMMTFYPPGVVALDELGIILNDENSPSLAERSSYCSRIDQHVFETHPLVAFPCWFDWEAFTNASHQVHLEFIRSLSDIVDDECFNLVRYRQCPIEPVHALPGKAGQTNTNPMMSGAMLFHFPDMEARIIGGDAFTHIVTRGLGLSLNSMDNNSFPKDGEVGRIVRHALALYAAIIEANNPTGKFMQCVSLLEHLASLGYERHKPFKEAKANIVRYLTNDKTESDRIKARLFELWGKTDEQGRPLGYRTRIVHKGERLEEILPGISQREELFRELRHYVSRVIDHMIQHSEISWDNYKTIRDTLGPRDGKTAARQAEDVPF
jgi:hypothetical protein